MIEFDVDLKVCELNLVQVEKLIKFFIENGNYGSNNVVGFVFYNDFLDIVKDVLGGLGGKIEYWDVLISFNVKV